MKKLVIKTLATCCLVALALPAAVRADIVVLLDNGSGGFNAYSLESSKTFDFHRRDIGLQTFGATYAIDGNTQMVISTGGATAGHLATISNAAENASVTSVGSGNRYIGLTDLTSTSSLDGFDYTTLGTSEAGNTSGQPLPTPGTPPVAGQRGFGFAWVTGEPLTFMNWNGGEPNDSGGEDAVHLTGANNWNDQNAGVTAGETDAPLAGIAEFDLNLASAAPATGTQGFNYREVKSTGTINSVATAEALLAGTGVLSSVSGIATVANQLDSGGDGHFGNNDAFLLGGDNYATEYTGKVYIPTAGDWTFGTNSDDGSFLQVGDQIKIDDVLSGAHDNFMTFNFAEAGFYDIRAVFFEAGGGAEFELFAAQGALGAFDGSFRLVGDTANGGLLVLTDVAVTPEPATLAVWSMLGVALAGFGYYRTRRKQ